MVSDESADLQRPEERVAAPGGTDAAGQELLAAALALVAEAEAALGDVERALERLDQGTYAQCEVCGAQIDAALLTEVPTLRRCSAHRELTD